MLQTSEQWDLVGPDGSTLSFNGSSGILLEDVTGFDMPSVRTTVEVLPEQDGAVAGDFYFGARNVTFSGVFTADTAADRNVMMVNLMRVARALRGDLLLKSQALGLPAMQANARLDQPLRITGQFRKRFMLSLVLPDPRLYSQTLHTGTASGSVPAGGSFPWSFPVSFGGGSAAVGVNVSNAGNFTTSPTIVVTGPAAAGWEVEGGSGAKIVTTGLALTAGQSVTLDHAARTAVRSDGTNVYQYVVFPDSEWWLLEPGSTTVRLWASGTSGATSLDISWRDAWS